MNHVRRGQSLVLLALTMLLVTLMVLMTISIGVTAARRADLNNAADAAAYSQAVATARTFNTASLLNRAIIAHYVTISGVQAQIAYVSSGHNYFNLAANQFRMMDMGPPYPITSGATFIDPTTNTSQPACGQRTTEVRDASYEMWHAALAWMARGSAPDEVNGNCQAGNCTMYRDWISQSLGQLELEAGREVRDVHAAIHDLSYVERDTYTELYDEISQGQFGTQVGNAAGIGSNLVVHGKQDASGELHAATASVPGEWGSLYKSSFHRAVADAIMGTRHEKVLELPDTLPMENLPPLARQFKAQTDAAFAAYPGQPFRVTFDPGDTSSDFAFQNDYDKLMIERPRVTDPMSVNAASSTDMVLPYLHYAFGRVQYGRVTTKYLDACAGAWRTIVSNPPTDKDRIVPDSVLPGVTYQALPFGVDVRSFQGEGVHTDYESDYGDGAHWELFGGGCHGAHQHYGWSDVNAAHQLNEDLLPMEMLGFVLPDPDMSEDGAHGVWGQPVLPMVLSRQLNPARDPWNLKFKFHFERGAGGTRFDMQRPVDEMPSFSTGIAYYHRRDHQGEPANMLNPYWRATLVPTEIDERRVAGSRYDPTQASQTGNSRVDQIINNELTGYQDGPQARTAYQALRNQVDGMRKVPQREP